MAEHDFTSARAELAQQRDALRRMSQQPTIELVDLIHAARRLRTLGARVGAQHLTSVSSAIVAWSERAGRSEASEQAGALLLELTDALERLETSQASRSMRWAALAEPLLG